MLREATLTRHSTSMHFSSHLQCCYQKLVMVVKCKFHNISAHLVDHGVNNVNEWLVAVQQTVTATEDVALQPALARVFR